MIMMIVVAIILNSVYIFCVLASDPQLGRAPRPQLQSHLTCRPNYLEVVRGQDAGLPVIYIYIYIYI